MSPQTNTSLAMCGEKLKVAEIAAKQDAALSINVEALKQVIPQDLSAAEISVRLGTTWIPESDIQQFVMELLTPSSHAAGRIKVRYTPYNGDWFIENKTSDFGNVKADSTYGTKRASAYRIIEDTLNLKDTRIFDYVYDEHGNKKSGIQTTRKPRRHRQSRKLSSRRSKTGFGKTQNGETALSATTTTPLTAKDPVSMTAVISLSEVSAQKSRSDLTKSMRLPISFTAATRFLHTRSVRARPLKWSPPHRESKRLGLCQKSMFVVPNHLVGQWASEYLRLYPSANILVARKQDFETANRKKFCGRIATGDYDAVIIGHSQFEKIQMSEERQRGNSFSGSSMIWRWALTRYRNPTASSSRSSSL